MIVLATRAAFSCVSSAQRFEQIHPPVAKHNCSTALAWQATSCVFYVATARRSVLHVEPRAALVRQKDATERTNEGILAMPKRKARAKSPTRRRQRPPSEWSVLSRYLRQMTGHDLDAYARLIAILKDRFARLDAREIWDRLRLEEGCIRLEMDRRGYDPAEEYEARRYGPDHLAHEIMMQ
jgi:hypothetical protein